jgi:hypothetical protein
MMGKEKVTAWQIKSTTGVDEVVNSKSYAFELAKDLAKQEFPGAKITRSGNTFVIRDKGHVHKYTVKQYVEYHENQKDTFGLGVSFGQGFKGFGF